MANAPDMCHIGREIVSCLDGELLHYNVTDRPRRPDTYLRSPYVHLVASYDEETATVHVQCIAPDNPANELATFELSISQE